MTAYNLRRIINIIGLKKLQGYLAEVFVLLCAKIALFELFLSHLNQIMKRIMNEPKITNRGVNNRMPIQNIIATASF
jgi:hypothetical protein